MTAASPPGTRDRVKAAFDAGYCAGADSAFGGYDGGWSLGEPYVIVLAKGGNGITYRIAARILARDGVDYHRCPPPASICQQPRVDDAAAGPRPHSAAAARTLLRRRTVRATGRPRSPSGRR